MKIGPKNKISRRLGENVFGSKAGTKLEAAPMKKRGGKRPKPLSEYGLQLLEKQKARYTYTMTERQFASYAKTARKTATPSASLYSMLESRLDNVIYRLGLVASRRFGRQVVSHGHITVNGRRILVPSHQVRPGDKIGIRQGSRATAIFRDLGEKLKEVNPPAWLVFDPAKYEGEIKSLPTRPEGESSINFSSILEFYSRV